jgi:hypothetical protein
MEVEMKVTTDRFLEAQSTASKRLGEPNALTGAILEILTDRMVNTWVAHKKGADFFVELRRCRVLLNDGTKPMVWLVSAFGDTNSMFAYSSKEEVEWEWGKPGQQKVIVVPMSEVPTVQKVLGLD